MIEGGVGSEMTRAINQSSRQRDAPSAPPGMPAHTDERRFGRSAASSPPFVIAYARRHLGFLAGLVIVAVATTVLTIVAVGLQLLLYPATHLSRYWLVHDLPSIVGISFSIALVAGALFEFRRLIGGRVLGSFLLGTYHRPRREQRIVMFLDIAGSTALGEQMGELRVHDLITRFFFDIDRPIADHDGEVHAYVGDQVIVTWPLSDHPERNARSLRSKAAGETLVASAEMLNGTVIPHGLNVGSSVNITLRGRQTPVEARTVSRNHPAGRSPSFSAS